MCRACGRHVRLAWHALYLGVWAQNHCFDLRDCCIGAKLKWRPHGNATCSGSGGRHAVRTTNQGRRLCNCCLVVLHAHVFLVPAMFFSRNRKRTVEWMQLVRVKCVDWFRVREWVCKCGFRLVVMHYSHFLANNNCCTKGKEWLGWYKPWQ